MNRSPAVLSVEGHRRVEALARAAYLVARGFMPDAALSLALGTMVEDERTFAGILLPWDDMALLVSVWPVSARVPEGRLRPGIMHCSEMTLALAEAAPSMPRIASDPVFYTRQFAPTPKLALFAAFVLESPITYLEADPSSSAGDARHG